MRVEMSEELRERRARNKWRWATIQLTAGSVVPVYLVSLNRGTAGVPRANQMETGNQPGYAACKYVSISA